MAEIKLLFKNTDGLDQEHSPSADTIQFASYKTANKELTDAKLGRLIDGADAADEHIHDARYFRKNQHIQTSTGATDANKPVNSNSAGKIDQTLIDVASLNPTLDHGLLIGLGDDDHLQYLRTDGTRPLTGIQSYATHPAFTDDKQLVDKKYVDDMNAGQEWYDSATGRLIVPPSSPTTGARYLIDGSLGVPTGAWAGKANQVATWNGSNWTYQIPTTGTHISIDSEPELTYLYGGSAWVAKSFEGTTASTGLVRVGMDIQIDPNAAGDGLGFSAGVLKVNTDNVGIEIATDILRIKDLGVKASKIDFGLLAGQVSGANIPLADVGNLFTTDNVEAALQQVAQDLIVFGVPYTVGAGGVTKGQPVYISANNTVLPYTTLTASQYVIGIAAATVAAGGKVKVLANDTLITGVLTGATAGTRYYWTGTAYSTAIPTTLGVNVWALGIAKNATDLAIEVEFVKKNSLV